jgi:outer membrane lipoprotein carrier protein
MKLLQSIFFLSLLTCSLSGQSDQQAVAILDKLSATVQAAPSVSMKFRLVSINQIEKTNDTLKGSVIMAKNQYRLELPNNITLFDGSASWNYLKAEKEVTITKPDKKDDSFFSKPASVFTLYKKGYKVRLVEVKDNLSIIDLYPTDLKSDLVRIRLTIDKNGYQLLRAEYKKNNGELMTLIVDEYNLKIKPDPTTFVFNANNYKGVEVIDMR